MKKAIEITHVLAVGDVGRPLVREFFRGLFKYSRLYNSEWVLYINAPHYQPPDLRLVTPENIRKWNIHGIIDATFNPAITHKLLSLGLPCIVGRSRHDQNHLRYSIDTDDIKIAETGAKYFLDKKFVNFSYCGVDTAESSENRKKAFADAVIRAGHSISIYTLPNQGDSYSFESDLSHLADWLKSLPKPVGLLAGSDGRGKHVLEACSIANLKVPEEVAVLGVGDERFICDLPRPPLSSICLNVESTGFKAAEILNQLMNGENLPPQKLFVEPTVIVERQSTDVLAINDDAVKQAIRFIRLNCTKPIGVANVAEAVCMTIRTLDRRFQNSLGRSVHGEISRIRIEQACRLMVETTLPVSEIAFKLGYSGPRHLRRAFKHVKGVGPMAYRKSCAVL